MAAKIKKGDQVIVISGDEKGKVGKVIKVFPKENRAIVEKVNLVKKHERFRGPTQPSGIIEKEAPIHLSNLALICPNCGERTKVGFRFEGERKIRYCKKCNQSVEK